MCGVFVIDNIVQQAEEWTFELVVRCLCVWLSNILYCNNIVDNKMLVTSGFALSDLLDIQKAKKIFSNIFSILFNESTNTILWVSLYPKPDIIYCEFS